MMKDENYWSEEALQLILERVRTLCHEDTEEALKVATGALEILERRIWEPPPDLIGVTLAVYAMTLRRNGKPQEALEIYDRALHVEGLTDVGRCYVYSRMAVPLVCLNRIDEGIAALNTALRLQPQNILAVALRGWAHLEGGYLDASLADCLSVIERTEQISLDDHSFLGAIVNAAAVLSCEAGVSVDDKTLELLKAAIATYRDSLPKNGTKYYKTQNLRLVLSRAEALLLARWDHGEKAISILRRVVSGLRERFPDDAFHASTDLVCILAKLDRGKAAAEEAKRTLELAAKAKFPPPKRAITVLRTTAKSGTISALQSVELRILLRQRENLRQEAP